jgi:hypothetical protein
MFGSFIETAARDGKGNVLGGTLLAQQVDRAALGRPALALDGDADS